MKPLFESNENWERMKSIIDSWLGTPYRHLAMVKGGGADCTLFIGACWKEYGILNYVSHEYYPKEWHIHTKQELILDSFDEHWHNHTNPGFTFHEFRKDLPIMRGDVLAFSTTSQHVTNHASIYLGYVDHKDVMCHVINGRPVSYFPFGHFWKDKMVSFFRVMEL